jgi:hypothetical protein
VKRVYVPDARQDSTNHWHDWHQYWSCIFHVYKIKLTNKQQQQLSILKSKNPFTIETNSGIIHINCSVYGCGRHCNMSEVYAEK